MENLNFEIKVYTKIKKNNMTYKELAKELGISQAYLSQILKGKRIAKKYKKQIEEKLDIRSANEE